MNTSLSAPRGALGVAAPSIVLAATFTADPLLAPLGHFLREVGLPLGASVAPYGQIFQQLLDPTSQFRRNRGGVNVVLLRFEDWLRDEGGRLTRSAGQGQKLERNTDDLVAALREATLASSVPIVVAMCPPSAEAVGSAELMTLGERLRGALGGVTGLRFLPMQWCEAWPASDIDDAEGDRLGNVPYTRRFFLALGRELTRLVHALKNPPAKVIVLDCDNTLWDGVVGEDGPSGITLTSRHRDLQSFVLAKKQAGMLLCLASKNVESDVLDVFEQRKDMLLRVEDIVAMRVNWLPKSENIHALASELNLGLDSFVFIDDNPIECAEVEAACPGVLVVCLPANEAPRRILGNLWPLDVLDVTDEDRRRSDMVRQNLARDRFAKSTGDLASFLAGLDLHVTCGVPTDEQRPRVSQLTQRTNQFNVSTKRCSEAEIVELVRNGYECRAIEVRDRFGDYGLVGVMLFCRAAEALVVDTFLLSCRVLGRGVEHAMLRELGALAQAQGLARVELPFVASKKNQPARRFLESLPATRREAGSTLTFVVAAEQAAAVVYAPGSDPTDVPVDGAATTSSVVLPAVVNRSRSERWSRLVRTIDQDHDLLAHLDAEARGLRQTAKPVVPPRTETERKLVRIWSDVLGVAEVGVEDDYVNDLGGTSLLAVSVFARIARELGVTLPLATLVEASTIAALGGRIDQPADRQSLVLLNGGGNGTPLFLVHDADGETLLYRNLAKRLGDRPVYGVQPHARVGAPVVHTRIPDMAAHYVAEIRKLYPRGPYFLGGLCAGGILASEIALQLEDLGETARLVAVFDAATVEAPRKPHLEDRRRLERVRQAWGEQSLAQASRAIAAKVGGYVAYQIQSTCTHLVHRAAVEGLRYYSDRGAPPPRWLRPPDVRSVYAIAEAEYRPRRALRDEILLFRASEGEGADEPHLRFYDDPLLGWGKHSQVGVRCFDVPGGHGSMLQEPHVAAIADILRPILADPRLTPATSSIPGGRAA
jgi:FkbH-like protein